MTTVQSMSSQLWTLLNRPLGELTPTAIRDRKDKRQQELQRQMELHRGKHNQALTSSSLKSILESGGDLNDLLDKGDDHFRKKWTKLFLSAIEEKDLETIDYLLNNSYDPNDLRSNVGFRAVLAAADSGDSRVIQKLLGQGFNIDATDHEGQSPLYYCAQYNKPEALQLLVQHGADISFTRRGGWTPLHSAIDTDSLDAVKVLIENGADVNTLHGGMFPALPLDRALDKNNTDISTYLIDNGATQYRAA